MEACHLSMPWGKMAYTCQGSRSGRTPLIFLHGSGCDSSSWDKVVARLPPEQHLVTVDFRGHGNSSTPSSPFTLADLATDVIILAEHLGLRQPVLVGHSLGGMAAMIVAQQAFPLTALVSIEGWTNLGTASRAFREPRFFGRLTPTLKAEVMDKTRKTMARFQPEVWNYFWQSVEAFDASAFLELTLLPIYEIYGRLGQTGTTRQNLMIPSKPNIELIWLENAGHYLPIEKPAELADILINYLATSNTA